MIALIAFIFVFGVLVAVHEFGHFIVAKKMGVKVEEFSLGFGKKLLKKKWGETEYSISLIPLGGYVKMAGEALTEDAKGESWEYISKPIWQRFCILFAGPAMNYITAFILFSLVFIIGAPQPTSRIGGLIEEYPAKLAGIQKDDVIHSISGQKTALWSDVTDAIRSSYDENLHIVLERDEKLISINLKPRIVTMRNVLGKEEEVKLLGIKPSNDTIVQRFGFIESIGRGSGRLWQLTTLTYQGLWALVTGQMSVKDSVSGPIGIFVMTGEVAKLGFIYLLQLMATLSTALAIFNLLPIPVLDGGHIFFLAIEKLKGRPLSYRSQEIISQVGLYTLLILMVFVSYFDVARLGFFEKITSIFTAK